MAVGIQVCQGLPDVGATGKPPPIDTFQTSSWSTLLKVTGPIVAFAASLSSQNPVTGMLVAQEEQDHGLHPLGIKVHVMSYTTFLGLS